MKIRKAIRETAGCFPFFIVNDRVMWYNIRWFPRKCRADTNPQKDCGRWR